MLGRKIRRSAFGIRFIIVVEVKKEDLSCLCICRRLDYNIIEIGAYYNTIEFSFAMRKLKWNLTEWNERGRGKNSNK